MQHWWGPKGVTIVKSTMDFRVGGIYHYGMKAPGGSIMWGRFVFREIVPPERIVFINSFSDENGGLTRHPDDRRHGRSKCCRLFLFEDVGDGKTKFTVTWSPHNASEAEARRLRRQPRQHDQGWAGTLDQLEAYLAGHDTMKPTILRTSRTMGAAMARARAEPSFSTLST